MPATFVTFIPRPLRSLPCFSLLPRQPRLPFPEAAVLPCLPLAQHTPMQGGPACLCRPCRNAPSSLSWEGTFAKTNRNKYSVSNQDLHRFHERPLGWKWRGVALCRTCPPGDAAAVMVYQDPPCAAAQGPWGPPLHGQSMQGGLFTQVFMGATRQIFIPTNSQHWDTLCPLDGDTPLEFGSCPYP